MAIEFAKLPFQLDALEPYMSKETLEYHYGKHHAAYVKKLNELIQGTEYNSMDLEDIVIRSATRENEKSIFNNAAQAWNHSFFWNCLDPKGSRKPDQRAVDLIEDDFGSLNDFKKKFTDEAIKLFGSGWAWLVLTPEKNLEIRALADAGTPITEGCTPLLTCDVWEHAYYIDHRNERPKFLESFWKLVNWEFVDQNLELSLTGARSLIKAKSTELRTNLM